MNLLQVGFTLGAQSTLPDVNDLAVMFTKLLFILGALLYTVFAIIVVRQIQLMKNTVVTDFSSVVQLLGYLHLVFALVVVVAFLVLL